MVNIYNSWIKRTKHIKGDCSYCNNERYNFDSIVMNDRTNDYTPTINACPACNFEDLQINQKISFIPLHKFVMIKNGTLDINAIE